MHFSKVRSSRLPPSISLTVFALVVLLMGFFTACSASKHPGASTSKPAVMTALDSPESVTAAIQQEGATLNLYWPAGGTLKAWIINKLAPGYKAYVKTASRI